MSKKYVRFSVSLPPALLEKLRATAKDECRTASGMIRHILQCFYRKDQG
ncbi:MAG: hypothetical protein EOM52_06370 [Clostridia bacterium]|nr:hypothetical protein [Clostridia bacterium]